MSDEAAHLALLLDAPMQSWGFASRFQRRTTGLYPTKSGVTGMICAAMGLAKGSQTEREMLPRLAELKMVSVAIPRRRSHPWGEAHGLLPLRRLEDFHTVLNTRRASGKLSDDPVVTRRQYLLDARFGVILFGGRSILERVAAAFQDPVWGVWFGRKNCIPAEIIFVDLAAELSAAWGALLRRCGQQEDASMESFATVWEAKSFATGTDTLNDQPVSFGDGKSSGPDQRQFAPRRIDARPCVGE
ncbi:MAG: type I-E CRISPR-associated protein Cas5/CasD [Planctomycetes bacterium]|nr:type I-E CRISPR-associated protein Cas5/CasD [Planctomycetota bacterium]